MARDQLRRLRAAMGFTQESLALELGIDTTTVRRWELGETEPKPHNQRKLTRLLKIDIGSLLELLAHSETNDGNSQSETVLSESHRWAQVVPPNDFENPTQAPLGLRQSLTESRFSTTSSLKEVDADMIRRDFLRLATTTTALLAVGPTRSQRAATVNIEEFRAVNNYLWRVYTRASSKSSLSPAIAEQLAGLHQALSLSTSTRDRRELCRLTSELYQLSGETGFDGMRLSDAASNYLIAAEAGKEARDFDLWSCSLVRHAFVSLQENKPKEAQQLLETAAALGRRGNSELSTRYWVADVQAITYARMGNFHACSNALDEAEQVRKLSDGCSNGGWLRFDDSRLAEQRSACYIELKRFDLAEEALIGASNMDLTPRRKAGVLSDLAAIGLHRQDIDQFLQFANQVISLAEHTGSGYIWTKLEQLRQHIHTAPKDDRLNELENRIFRGSQRQI